MNSTQVRPIADPHNPTPELTSASPLIEGDEKLEDRLAHREIVVQELCPVGALEVLYAGRAALYLWRLERITRFEIAAKFGEIEAGSSATCEDPANGQEHRVSPDQSTLQTIIKYEAHLQRCLAGTMAELRRLQKERRQGLRDANRGGRGADRAGVCQNEFDEKGSHGGSPSQKSSPIQKITGAEMSISGGRGADRAGVCVPGGRGADRAGVCQNEFDEKGSHGGSPSHKITGAEMSISGGRGADRAGVCQNQEKQDGSHGGSPSRKRSPSHKSSPPQKNSTSRKNATARTVPRSQRASPAPKIPPLLEAISRRRRLEEYILGQNFERSLPTGTLDFTIGRCP